MTDRHLEHDWFPEPIPKNVILGDRNWLYSSFAFRHYRSLRPVGLQTGHDTGLYNGTFFDLGVGGEVWIGSYCTLVGAIICSNHRIDIGNYVFIAHEVVLADSPVAVPHSDDDSTSKDLESDESRVSIEIEDDVWIGARAVLLDGARIGRGAVVGAGAVVDFEVPPYSVAAGNPGTIVRRPLDRSE